MADYPDTISEGVRASDAPAPSSKYHTAVTGGVVKFFVGKERLSQRTIKPVSLSTVIHVTPSQSCVWRRGAMLSEIARLHHTQSITSKYRLLLQDYPYIRDAIVRAFPVRLSEGVGVHAVVAGAYGILMQVGARLSESLAGRSSLHALLSDVVGLSEVLDRFAGAFLTDHVGVHGALGLKFNSRPIMTEGVRLSEVLGRTLLFSYTMAEGVEIAETDIIKAIYHQTYIEGIRLTATYISPGGSITTWAVNMRNGAATEYTGFKFNSFAKIGNKYIAASQDGLYELDGDTDDGTDIIADFAGGYTQFGGSHFASLKAVYLGVRGSGDFIFRLVEGDGTTRDYAVTAQTMKTARIDLGKGLRSRYFSWELISTGQDFDLDSIEFVPVILKRRV